MIEPLAVAVVNSFLLGRSPAGHCASLQSAARVASRPMPPNFFTPLPRRLKGKEKAEKALTDESSQCTEWSMAARDERCCAVKLSLWCIKQNRPLMMKEVIPTRYRSIRRQTPQSAYSMRRSPSFYALANAHKSQIRHASNTSPPLSGPEGLAWHTFTWHINSPDNKFDADVAWAAFDQIVEKGHIGLKPKDILLFVDRVTTHAERLYHRTDALVALHASSHRIQSILDRFARKIAPVPKLNFQRQCLQIRVMAMAGDIEQAESLAHALQSSIVEQEDKMDIFVAYQSIIRSIWRHHDAIRVLDFLTLEWQFLGNHLMRHTARAQTTVQTVAYQSHRLRHIVHVILESIPDPVVVLAERRNWSKDRRLRTGELFMEVLCVANLPQDGLAVLHEMERQFLDIPISLKLTLVRSLVRADAFELANALYRSLSTGVTRFKYYTSTGLYLFAHQGDVLRAQEKWDDLEENGWVSAADIGMLLQVHAVEGSPKDVERLFNEFFVEPTGDLIWSEPPTIVHFTIVIFAYAQHGDFDGMNVWLEKMAQAGFAPDEHVYNIILKSFAMRGEVDSLAAVLDQMRTMGMQPSVVHYTTAISLLARRRDPVGAEALYKRALQEGVIPDRRMVTALMNAHVEAASWQGVIRAFDYMKSSLARHVFLSIEVYNTLLKAYVLIGAPFHVVSSFFDKLEGAKVRPNAYTFALLVQSACDAGMMKAASEIFQQMDQLARHWESHLHIDVYVLTILMSGFLRTGDKVRAKGVYDEMRERNIQPTSATFSAILRAYGNQNTQESLQIAEKFLKSLVEAEEKPWLKPTKGRSALEDVYRPLMDAYARNEKPEDVERHFQAMLDAGGEATLGVLTTLLHAYCRTGNVAAALQVWPQIFQLGLRYSRTDSLFDGQNETTDEDANSESQTKRQANILCVPLSIYIDALSTAGMHTEIAAVWKKVKMHGFAFDSHNWNHLAIALIRAGEPERAFEVMEKVILPYQKRSLDIMRERDQEPETPLTFEGENTEDDTSPEPAFEGPMHSLNRRAVAVKVATRHSKHSRLDADNPDDFAHPLHILHQISPSWSIWRPHNATLSLLARVLASLQKGMPVEPVSSVQGNHEVEQAEEWEQRRARVNLAAEILGRIYINFPNTVRVIEEHQRHSHIDRGEMRRAQKSTIGIVLE